MSRLDWKSGRFDEDFEITRLQSGLEGWQNNFGTTIQYYRFEKELSGEDDIYDESSGLGKMYKHPIPLPVLSAYHGEGAVQQTTQGQYEVDTAHIRCSYDQIRKAGLTSLDLATQSYRSDRFIYDNIVFRVTQITIIGQIRGRDVIAAIEGVQVKPDELVNDSQFDRWAG